MFLFTNASQIIADKSFNISGIIIKCANLTSVMKSKGFEAVPFKRIKLGAAPQ